MDLAAELIEECRRRKVHLATAESCTGGMVAARLTAVAGASAVFPGSVVAYANEVKERLLQVPTGVLVGDGAVSGSCAAAMATGVRKLMASDVAVSLTGIAGPEGGTAEKPVGLVWFGLASIAGVTTYKECFKGGRNVVRQQATEYALKLLLQAVKSIENA